MITRSKIGSGETPAIRDLQVEEIDSVSGGIRPKMPSWTDPSPDPVQNPKSPGWVDPDPDPAR